ncbi:hypothetical protein BH11PLA1_BH11PLA1_23820 [soil metagenome]
MRTSTKIGAALTIASLALALVSAWCMAQRVKDYYLAMPPARWHFEALKDRNISVLGQTLAVRDAELVPGVPAVEIAFGTQSVKLPVHAPVAPNYTDLTVYDDWLAVLGYVQIKEGVVTAAAGEKPRYVIVNRREPTGFSPDTWGAVRIKDWTFDFVELNADGTMTRTLWQFPSRDRNTGQLYLPAQRDDPTLAVEMIQERSWQWQAALFAIPKSQISRYRYLTDAVAGSAGAAGMGWTLPVAGFAIMGAMVGGMMWMAGSVGKRGEKRTRVGVKIAGA